MLEIELTEEELRKYGIDVDALEDSLSDAISDKTGYCHTGFSFTVVIKAELDETE